MQPSYDFALAIPTLNEAENLPFLLKRLETPLLAVPGNSEILIVDDDSHDGTAEIIAEYSSSHPNLRLLVRQGRSGLAGAVLYGWQQTQATTLGVMDADLQHPPELLPVLVEKVREGADIAIASRYAEKRPVNGLSAGRYAVSRLGTLVCM